MWIIVVMLHKYFHLFITTYLLTNSYKHQLYLLDAFMLIVQSGETMDGMFVSANYLS